ncbi:TonB-dependent receptor [Aquabacterium sp.]|uniref:TonB-dependent receptor plug domain-containing protein n=1 Tax=Aquabacterium sp. TaxID=1872578 RepID=UPI0019AAEBB8|nr:TonB-dependent receptor [Aquabacterium sp.]MBC7702074.1 TonB-dependent receptor [Aquabacterium sp.]
MTPKQYLVQMASAIFVFGGAAHAQAQGIDSAIDLSDVSYPVVITPTRLRQSLADVPASVTVITADTLRRYGITRIEEALRLVPGMAVSQATGNDFRVNFHGTKSISPRRLNVLIDGVSAYMSAFSQVQWSLLPVVLDDVERIEVIRGPDSSAYGPNSMMAVVNILTKHPKDVERGLVSMTTGSHGMLDGTVRLATTVGSTSVRATVSSQHDHGYDRSSTIAAGHDSTSIHRLNLRAQQEMSDGSSLDMQVAHVGGKAEEGMGDPFQATPPDRLINSTLFSGRWTKSLSSVHEVQVNVSHVASSARQRWTSCWPQAAYWPEVAELFQSNPDYVKGLFQGQLLPPGASARDNQLVGLILARVARLGGFAAAATSTCGRANQDGSESRSQIELQDTLVVSDQLRFVAGLGLRYQRSSSETFFGGAVSNHVQWLFGHAEYRPLDWLTANVGGYGESNSLSGSTFSPRLAINARLSDQQTVRAVVSKGTRTPDLFEERANWSYTLRDLSIPIDGSNTGRLFTAVKAHSGLSSEQIWSRELGYLLMLRRIGLTLDARLFDDHLSHLISERLSTIDFTPDNTGSVRLTGAELQLNWDLSERWSTWASYGYLLNRQASSIEETTQYARHSGALGVSLALSPAWRVSAAHYAASGDGVHEVRYARTDLTLAHSFWLGAQPGAVSLTLRYLDTPSVNTYQDVTRYFTSSYDQQLSIHGQVRVAF